MLSIVDGVPRTLRLDQMISYYVAHQIEVIVRRTQYRLDKAEKRAHILRGLVKALDMLDEVIALIRRSPSAEESKAGLMALLDVDEIQATAILDMQLRRLAALERQKIIDELAEIELEIADLKDILARPERQRQIVKDELTEAVDKYGDDRRTRLVPYDGDVSMEDLIAVEDVVVTITRTGYAKRTKTDLYRAQRRGGKGVQGAALKQDDIVAHFFVCSTHDWILFFTNKGRVYRAKAYELPEANRNARGQHVANLLAFQPDEKIAQVIQIRNYEVAPYLVLATKGGLVKKSELTAFDSNRSGGIVGDQPARRRRAGRRRALRRRRGPAADLGRGSVDPLPRHRRGAAADGPGHVRGARACGSTPATSCCRWTSCTRAPRCWSRPSAGTPSGPTSRNTRCRAAAARASLTIQYDRRRGKLVGALIVDLDTEVYAITSSGGVIRTLAREVRKAKRQTMGVRLMNLSEGDSLVAIARNADADPVDGAAGAPPAAAPTDGPADGASS